MLQPYITAFKTIVNILHIRGYVRYTSFLSSKYGAFPASWGHGQSYASICSLVSREVFSHPYISFFHLLVNCFCVIYSVTIILRKILVITYTENYGESQMRASERCFHLVLLVQSFTRSLPTRIAAMVDTKQSSKTVVF